MSTVSPAQRGTTKPKESNGQPGNIQPKNVFCHVKISISASLSRRGQSLWLWPLWNWLYVPAPVIWLIFIHNGTEQFPKCTHQNYLATQKDSAEGEQTLITFLPRWQVQRTEKLVIALTKIQPSSYSHLLYSLTKDLGGGIQQRYPWNSRMGVWKRQGFSVKWSLVLPSALILKVLCDPLKQSSANNYGWGCAIATHRLYCWFEWN